jgi:hypothetical protein
MSWYDKSSKRVSFSFKFKCKMLFFHTRMEIRHLYVCLYRFIKTKTGVEIPIKGYLIVDGVNWYRLKSGKKSFAPLIDFEELCSVQPMMTPTSGSVFKFRYIVDDSLNPDDLFGVQKMTAPSGIPFKLKLKENEHHES